MQKAVSDITVFADGLDHPESVAIHPDGSIWCGGEAGQIYRITANGKQIEEMANTGGFVLGIAFSPSADWLAICDLKHCCVWRFDLLTRMLTRLELEENTPPIRIPNYPVFDHSGNIYVSDSGAFREVSGMIYRFDCNAKGKVWHPGPFSFTNGMALSENQRSLYAVCSWLPGIEQIKILDDGTAGERSVLVEMPGTCPDGIAIDQSGNFYISCYAPNSIYKYAPSGGLSILVHDWEAHTICNPTNIAFGGPGNQQLFIANLGRWHIATMKMDIPGLLLH